jgi:hypothetical protein
MPELFYPLALSLSGSSSSRTGPTGIPFVFKTALEGKKFADKREGDLSLPLAFRQWHRELANDLRAFLSTVLDNRGTRVLLAKAARTRGTEPSKVAACVLAERTARAHQEAALFDLPSLELGKSGVVAKPTHYNGA